MSVDTFVSRTPSGPFILSSIELLKGRRAAFYLRHTRTMPVDIPAMAVAFSAQDRDGRLANVHLVLNSGVAVPTRLKETQKLFEGKAPRDVKPADLRAALAQDTSGLRLDDYKRLCLELDAGKIIARLKK